MLLDKFISDLLLEHDCVIVPDFGGFVTNISPAVVHASQHVFTPPSKEIVFNKNLKRNDGLLANHIATEKKISYSEAINFIVNCVKEFNHVLYQGNHITINDVGVLYFDIERNIQFEPDKTINYLLDSFGLTALHSQPVKRENYRERIEKQFVDRKPVPVERKKINVKRYVAIAIAIPFFVAAIWIPLKTDLLKKVNYSNLNPFAHETTFVAQPSIQPTIVKPIETETASVDSKKDTIIVTKPVEQISTAVVTSQLIQEQKEVKRFHIIGGCFTLLPNAEKLISKLQREGYNSSLIDQDHQFYRVSYNSYANRADALAALSNIRSRNPEAWLLVK